MLDISLPEKITDAGEEKGQVDSGVEVGHDSPTGSLRLNDSSRLEELSSIDSLVSNTCKNGDITYKVCIYIYVWDSSFVHKL